jgi:hypothetical protein
MIEIEYTTEMGAVLDALGIPWKLAQPANGSRGTIYVFIDEASDACLETVIGQLSAIRWKHQPGRVIQLGMELP